MKRARLPVSDHVEDVAARGDWLDTPRLQQEKRRLTAEHGVEAGFAHYRELNPQREHDAIQRRQLASLKEIAQTRDGAFYQTAPPEPFVIPPPTVVGDGAVGPIAGIARSMFVACLVDARVRSGSNVIEVDEFAALDYQGDELSRINDRIDLDPAIFSVNDGEAWIVTPPAPTSGAEVEEGFTLLGFRPRAFGHLLLEYLPKYLAAWLSGALPPVPLLIEAGLPPAHRQAIELLIPPEIKIIEVPRLATVRVRRLWCASNLAYFPVFEAYDERFKWEYFAMPPARYAPVIRAMAARAAAVSPGPTRVERLFLARETSWHDVSNQAAIIAAAEARGFQTVYPNRLDFCEQVRLTRDARFIVGPSGGALFLAFFARPGTNLCMFRYSEDVVAAQIDMTGLFAEAGIRTTVLTGRCTRPKHDFPPGSDFEIDEQAFCRFLDRWLQS